MMNPKNGPIATMNSLRILTSILAICHFHSLRQVYTLLRVGHKEEKRLEFCTFWKKNRGFDVIVFAWQWSKIQQNGLRKYNYLKPIQETLN